MAHILIFIHWFVLVFTFGNVELVTIDNSKSNDFPIEELNNHTLSEVFEIGNKALYNGNPYIEILGNQPINNNRDNLEILNGSLRITALSNDQNIGFQQYPTYNLIMGNSYYINVQNYYENKSSGITTLRFQTVSPLVVYNITDKKSLVFNATQNSTTLYLYVNSSILWQIGEYWQIDGWYLVDKTNLGIDLTKEQMDYWFNIYQENAQREISETYDYIENELTTNDLIYIVLFALLWGLAIKIVKGVM